MAQLLSAIIFDMDGVLCDSEPFICEAAIRMFGATYGQKVEAADFLPFVGTGENRYLGGVAEKYGIRLDIERDKARTYEIYLEIIPGRLRPFPGVHEFIGECRRRALKLAVATSADRIKLDGNLRELDFPPDTFDACVTGSEVRRKKPFPDLFLAAARRLGIEPARCVVVEDAPSGILAARRAGARCLGLTTGFAAALLVEAGANWTAPDLARAPRELFDGA